MNKLGPEAGGVALLRQSAVVGGVTDSRQPLIAAIVPGVYRDRVRIMTDRHDVSHPRHPHNGVSTLLKHATSALAAVSGSRAELYYQRQRLLEVSPSAEAFLTELVHARPHTWASDVRRLFELLLEHGPERMAGAFQQALERGWHGAELVEPLLTRPWGMLEEVRT